MAEDQKGPEGGSPKAVAEKPVGRQLDRRDVLLGLSTVPALGLFGYAWRQQRAYERRARETAGAERAASQDVAPVNVALLGAGAQGQVLLDAMLRIPGLRFRAVCDVWTEYNQKRVVNTLRKFKHAVTGYEDYREMLDKEQELDAVVIATPDFWHAPPHRRLPARPANTSTARRRCRTRSRARAAWCSPLGRPASSSRSAISGAATPATGTATRSCCRRRSSSDGSSPSTASGTARSRRTSAGPSATRSRRSG